MEKIIRLSNDAFFFLLLGEEPLDDAAYPEAEKIASELPSGFQGRILRYLDDGMVEASFTFDEPEEEFKYDYFWNATLYCQLQVQVSGDTVKYRWHKKNRTFEIQEVPLMSDEYGEYFLTKFGSRIPIRSLTPA